MAGIFKRVQNARPGRSVFNLSYEKKFTADMGQLIPIMHDEMVPGDIFKIGNEMVCRMQPLVAPVLHEINIYTHYYFVPYRLLDDEWEDFITGGVDGENAYTLPTWDPGEGGQAVGSLWDYFGLPIGVRPNGAYPLDYMKRAYNLIWNEYYRDETLQDELDITANEEMKFRCWEKDYFTSAMPFMQRGTAPGLPVSGTTFADFTNAVSMTGETNKPITFSAAEDKFNTQYSADADDLLNTFNKNVVDLSSATTFTVSDLRLAFQIQRWLERNERAGARYIEFLGAHFGVHPSDARLQRPEYIGGSKTPVIISEVLQTSQTDVAGTPQGTLAGHGITADRKYIASYKAEEFGIVIGILSIMPKPAYSQGINRQWLRRTKYDFYFPEFANLSEQAIEKAEILALDDVAGTHNQDVFGYQGRYDEMRYKPNIICGELRPEGTLEYWHLAREFDPGSPPELNESFIVCDGTSDSMKRIFAVQDEPGFIINYANIIKAIRPMPIMATPGLIDHY